MGNVATMDRPVEMTRWWPAATTAVTAWPDRRGEATAVVDGRAVEVEGDEERDTRGGARTGGGSHGRHHPTGGVVAGLGLDLQRLANAEPAAGVAGWSAGRAARR